MFFNHSGQVTEYYRRTTLKNYILIIIIILYLAVCDSSAYAKSDVDTVMNAKLPYDKSITIGDAFNNFRYFENKTWKIRQEENNSRLVIFIGTLDLEKLKQYNIELTKLQAAFIRVVFVINIDNSIDVRSFSYQTRFLKEFKLLDWNMDTSDDLKYSVLNIYKNDYKSGLIISNEISSHIKNK